MHKTRINIKMELEKLKCGETFSPLTYLFEDPSVAYIVINLAR
jgi:hypothetical protein